MKEIFLTIVIPFFNRVKSLEDNIKSILKSSNKDFEILVIDNCSTCDYSFIDKVNDERLKIIKRSVAVHPNENGLLGFELASGQMVMLCLDKDGINGQFLDELIYLIRDNDIRSGFCVLNSSGEDYKIYENAFSLFAYKNIHPSGCFMMRQDALDVLKEIDSYNPKSDFYLNSMTLDFFLANSLLKGKFLVYNKPLLKTEKSDDRANIKSYTYTSAKKNLYFEPDMRIKQFFLDIKHMKYHLNVNRKMIKKTTKRLYKELILNCTIQYVKVLKDISFCAHYGLRQQTFNFKTKYKIMKKASNVIFKTDIYMIDAIVIYIFYWIKFYMRELKLIIK